MEFVFDRSETDVANARRIKLTRAKEYLVYSEMRALERGTLSLGTLNRIEANQRDIAKILQDMGYYNNDLGTRQWATGMWFTVADFDRIIENNEKLKASFIPNLIYTTKPRAQFHYSDINKIEETLHRIYSYTEDVKSNYCECGNAFAGEG